MIKAIRTFYGSMGLVEQSQAVASTAVVVAMGTIVTAHFVTGNSLRLMDFISVLTVGVIGFVSVFFSLKYGRQLEEQRRELVALNTIAEAVNHSVELNYVLQSSLVKVMELMRADCGWIYLFEDRYLALKHQYGTEVEFFRSDFTEGDLSIRWIKESALLKVNDPKIIESTTLEFKKEKMLAVACIPLEGRGFTAGVVIIASRDERKFEARKIPLTQAFGNQISVALQNASLFEQVKRSEQLYLDLYEHSPDMYHSVNQFGIIISCNLTESQMLGIPKEEIIGKSLLNLYPASQHEHVRNNLKKIFEFGKELKGIEEQLQRRDGSLIDVSVNTSIVHDGQERAILARIVLRDITEKNKMEEKILQAQKIDSIGSMAGGIAHNFNNILTSILGSASIMRRKIKDDARWTKYVDLIEAASRQGASLTRQILTFARKSNTHTRLVNMNIVIDDTIRLFEATAPRSIHIKCNLLPEQAIVEGDEGQLKQTILNICLNARDAMPNGGVLVVQSRLATVDDTEAQQFPDGKPGEYVVVSVADSGTGIPVAIRNQIFEPFFTTKDAGKGTGLGLSVVYGVVRSHNGYVHVESEVDSGTVFTIYLPRVTEVRVQQPVQTSKTEIVGGTERILLIEDEISVGEVGFEILKDLGYDVAVARNGREALEKIAEASPPFDAVILDMNMPRMGGRATFKRIKEQSPYVKVLVCSGYSTVMLDDGKFVEAIDGFIQKPYELSELAQKVRKILDMRLVSSHAVR